MSINEKTKKLDDVSHIKDMKTIIKNTKNLLEKLRTQK
jgi:hypothetical protein